MSVPEYILLCFAKTQHELLRLRAFKDFHDTKKVKAFSLRQNAKYVRANRGINKINVSVNFDL